MENTIQSLQNILSSAPSGRVCTEGMWQTGAVRVINIRTHLHQNRLVSIDIHVLYIVRSQFLYSYDNFRL